MKQAYLAISYSKRKHFNKELQTLTELLAKNSIKLLVFVDKYNFKKHHTSTSLSNQEMMKTAFQEIDKSDFLIAELTTKSIGVGIEIGYAYAKEKAIFYIRKKGSEYSTTASGSSSYLIEYDSEVDLRELMEELLEF